MRQIFILGRTLSCFAACFISIAAFAQAPEAWPTRPITMVVPFPPGGVADAVGRPVAEALVRILGQPVVVENKAGAGGSIGMAAVAKAKPRWIHHLNGFVVYLDYS